MKINLEHHLNVAEKGFLFFIDNMNKELAQWVHYNKPIFEGSHVFFEFKSSQNSLTFKSYAGVALSNEQLIIKSSYRDIDDYFERIIIKKYNLDRLTYKEMIKHL